MQVRFGEKCQFWFAAFPRNKSMRPFTEKYLIASYVKMRLTVMHTHTLNKTCTHQLTFLLCLPLSKHNGDTAVSFFSPLFTCCKLIFSWTWSCLPGKPAICTFHPGVLRRRCISVMFQLQRNKVNSILCSLNTLGKIGKIVFAFERKPTYKIRQ